MITPLLILVVFLIFAALMYTRAIPALLAVPAMAVIMAAVAGVPWSGIGTVVVGGASSLSAIYVAVIFGALLGRVTLDTGIAKSIVNFAAEFGGERPPAVALALSAVVALLFVSLSGLGAVIMVGAIVLPIMMTTGVPRRIAATMFLMAFALGYIFNIVNWKFYTQYFGVDQQQMYGYAVWLAVIDLVALLAYTALSFARARGYATWALRAEEPATRRVPWFALITPVLPIVLYFGLHLDPIVGFAVSAIYGALTTGPSRAISVLTAAAIRGIEDVAPAIILFIGIGMLRTATQQPQFAAALHPLAAAGLWHNPLSYVAIFGLLSPLVLYRGPLNPFGIGIAVFTVLLAAHALPAVILVAAIMAVVQVQNVCDPTNTQNVWIANYTGVPVVEITKRTLPFQVAVATAACILVVVASGTLFHVRPFAALVQTASAQTLPAPGMFAPDSVAGRVAVGDDGSADAQRAAGAVLNALSAAKIQAFALDEDSNASDCTNKRYAAYVSVSSTRFTVTEGTDVDVGVQLADCGGWEVDEWHDHAIGEAVEQLGAQGANRLLQWAAAHPQRWQNLLRRGLAYAAGDPASYYFSLYKTVDGNLRAYVRAGGPAYAAGLRSGDVVEKLDNQFWWEYGTYQSQLRAYDGKPHSFELLRSGATIDVQLGAPFIA